MEALLALFIGVMAGAGVFLFACAPALSMSCLDDTAVVRGERLHLRDGRVATTSRPHRRRARRVADPVCRPLPQALVLTASSSVSR